MSVDGGCPGIADVKAGVIGATSQQYPLLMASLGVEAIKQWADDGSKPSPTPGKNFFDTGVSLVTDKLLPVLIRSTRLRAQICAGDKIARNIKAGSLAISL